MPIKMLSSKTGYIAGSTTVGVIFSENGVIIIDNGWGEYQGEKILKKLREANKRLIAVINTHTHLDHCGANRYLRRQTGCDIYCSKYEANVLRAGAQMVANITSGSLYPIAETRALFEDFGIDDPIELSPGYVTIDGVELEVVELPGHMEFHIGIVYDDVLFCGDALIDADHIRGNKFMFAANPIKARATYEYLKTTNYSIYCPAHGKPFYDPKDACDTALENIDALEADVLSVLEEKPLSLDATIGKLTTRMDIHIKNMSYYNIVKKTTESMLNSLIDLGLLDYTFEDNMLVYKKLKEGEVRETKEDKILSAVRKRVRRTDE